ncbi:hypothetical protein F5880DRAFT_1665399, partial [Lentinula raphanica]
VGLDGGVKRTRLLPMLVIDSLPVVTLASFLKRSGPGKNKMLATLESGVETGIGKFDDRSIKCQFIGYEGPGLYRCKVVGSDEVLRSRDLLFEEGDGHWVSSTEGETEEDTDVSFLQTPVSELDNVDPLVTSAINNIEPTRIEDNRIAEDSRGAENSPDNQNQNHVQPPKAPRKPRSTIPREPTRRSTRARNLTKAMMESKEYQENEEKAREMGESWAGDWEIPILPEFDEDEEGGMAAALIAQNEPLAPASGKSLQTCSLSKTPGICPNPRLLQSKISKSEVFESLKVA